MTIAGKRKDIGMVCAIIGLCQVSLTTSAWHGHETGAVPAATICSRTSASGSANPVASKKPSAAATCMRILH